MYDAIVVGARDAGSPVAMLLARKGYHTLVVDRATFPSDTVSTHFIHAPGVAALRRWGLLDEVVATGCPPVETYAFDFGPFTIRGTTRPVDGITTAYAPRRTVLDAILVEAAATAGAEVRENFNVNGLVVENGAVVGIRHGDTVERARIVIGADGRTSHVARAVEAQEYNTKPRLQYGFYSYFSNLPVDGMETYIRPNRWLGFAPTNDGLTIIVACWPYAEAQAYKANVEANFLATLCLVPSIASRRESARREAPFLGGAVRGYFRKPFGPGWALIGDAGYNTDPITAQGITDAFHDAERCTDAIDAWLSGAKPYDEAMADWQQERDAAVMPMYEVTSQIATLEPPPPEMRELHAAMHGNQEAMDGFVSVVSGAVSPVDFFSEENLGRIFAEPATRRQPPIPWAKPRRSKPAQPEPLAPWQETHPFQD
ncbi:MAG TPA: NAD(P)/FAD-dependent oxidoreductase [Jiangellaceae bacterium]|nr:NAD(P)/FAD-dependent oxidoreductase [Jiangellaceae bacterium]